MFYVFGLSIACFLVLLILLKRGKAGGDYILLTWMVAVTVHLLLFYLEYNRTNFQYPHLLGLALPLPVLHGALLYFYTVRTTRGKFLKPSMILACLAPFITMSILAMPFYILPPDEKIRIYELQGAGFEWYMTIQGIMIPCCGLLFSTASILAIKKHRQRMLNNFSNNDKKTLKWLQYAAIALAVIWIIAVFFDDEIVFSGVVIFVLLIGLLGINQAPVFYAHQNIRQPGGPSESADTGQNNIADETDKYSKSGLKEKDALRLKAHLDDFMKVSKPYKYPDLTLDGLAEALHIPSNQLSQIINSIEQKTFYHYINTYRIHEFLEVAILPESKKFTYLGLAYDCGFNSKSTFNKYFKLHTGKTPSEYFTLVQQNELSHQE